MGYRFLGVLLAALAVAACGDGSSSGNASETGPTGGAGSASSADRSLVFGITQYPSTLHPIIENMSAKSIVRTAVPRC